MKLEKFKQRDPKKIGITIFTVACILLIAGVFFYTSFASFEVKEDFNIINGTVGDPGDLYFAFYVDGVISKDMPQKGEGYVIDQEKTTCNNGASVEFNTDDWSVKVVNMTKSRTKCTLHFKKYIPPVAETILAKGETDELKFDDTSDKNLRYIGANPNNYVKFNNELWRIIGVFNNVKDENNNIASRIKIIKVVPYSTDIKWDTNVTNNWETASLQSELNTTYYESIEENSKNMIDTVVWYISYSYLASNPYQVYFWERNNYYDVNTREVPKWTGKIALMHLSDYGYATSGGSGTDRDTCLDTELSNWSSVSDCYTNNWLYSNTYYQWTLTPYYNYAPSSSVFIITTSGMAVSGDYGTTASPVLYLDENIKFTGGDGSESNPFTLSL